MDTAPSDCEAGINGPSDEECERCVVCLARADASSGGLICVHCQDEFYCGVQHRNEHRDVHQKVCFRPTGLRVVEGKPVCSVCGVKGLLCARCGQAAYCTKQHQMEDWPHHKKSCKKPSVDKINPKEDDDKIMGISLEEHRWRIGCFSPRSSSSHFGQGYPLLLRLVPFATLVILLLIAGIEANPGPVLPCHYCDLSFNTASSYFQHMKVHQLVKKFMIPCCYCSRQLKLTSFQSHISRYHRSSKSRPQVQQMKSVQCSVCKVELSTRKDYMDHTSEMHLKKGVAINCVLSNCRSQLTDVRKFQKHMSRNHPPAASSDFYQPIPMPTVSEAGFSSEDDVGGDNEENNQEEFYDCNSEEPGADFTDNLDDQDPYPEYVIKDEIARFYLKLEGEFAVPTSTVQCIASEIKLISMLSHHRLKIALREQLESANLDASQISSIVKATFRCDPIFNVHHKNEDIEQLCTHHLRQQYWHKRFPFVEPKDHYFGTNAAGKKRRAQFVPIKETLKILLQDKTIKDMVLKSFDKERCGTSVLQDFTDGEGYLNHQCQHSDGKCIQLLLFQDAFEFNAFGPSASFFKTLGFYYLIGNLEAEFRSKVDLIQLAALVLEKDTVPTQQEELDGKDVLKEAIQPILTELEDLKLNGIEVDGEKIPVCLLYLIGDNLGQHTVGGYVKNFNCDFFCRYCPMSKAEFLSNPSEVKPLRTPEEYDEAVVIANRKWKQRRKQLLIAAKKASMRKARKQAEKVASRCSAPAKKGLMKLCISKTAFKKMCAVSFRAVKYRPSPFNSVVTKFHVSSPAMPPCIAHDIFEGILRVFLPKVMHYCIHEKEWFDLNTLNRRIRNFKYKGSDKRDAPKPYKSIDKLSGNAVQNWNHLRLLPLIIGDLIEDPQDEVWQAFLSFKNIVEYVSAPKISMVQVAYLKHLIREFIDLIKKLGEFFPDCLIQKMHFLCHVPDLIAIFGPLIRLFTLRFESVHKFFKTVVRNSRNYINITKMMVDKYMYRFACNQSSNSFPAEIIYDPSSSRCLNMMALPPEKRAAFPGNFDPSKYEALTSIIVKGTEYEQGFYVMIKATMDSTSIIAGRIELILLDASNKVTFLLEEKEARNNFNGYYELEKFSSRYKLVAYKNLMDYYPLPSYTVQGTECFTLKHSICPDA